MILQYLNTSDVYNLPDTIVVAVVANEDWKKKWAYTVPISESLIFTKK